MLPVLPRRLAAFFLFCLTLLPGPGLAGEFRVGALLPLTGSGHAYGPGMLTALKIARDEINAAGGVLGDTLKLVVFDSGADPASARTAAIKLIEDHHVAAILGVWPSDATLAVLPLTTAARIILMNVSAASEISDIGRKTGLVFRTQASDKLYGEVFAEVARRAGFTRASVLAVDTGNNRTSATSFVRNFTRKGGQIAADVVYPSGRPSYGPEVKRAIASGPQVLALWSYMGDTRAILGDAAKLSFNGQFIAGGWAVNPSLLDVLAPQVKEKLWVVNVLPHLDSECYLHFSNKFKVACGEDPKLNPYSVMVYDQLMVLSLAAESAKSTAPLAIRTKIVAVCSPPGHVVQSFEQGRDLIRSGALVNFDGASSELMFDEAGDVRPDFGVYRIENNELVEKFVYRPYY